MAVQYYHLFKIKCRMDLVMDFPIDMLRYDSAYPHQTVDANKIEQAFSGYAKAVHSKELGEVTLAHIGDKHWQPTAQRWDSMGWIVVEVSKPLKL